MWNLPKGHPPFYVSELLPGIHLQKILLQHSLPPELNLLQYPGIKNTCIKRLNSLRFSFHTICNNITCVPPPLRVAPRELHTHITKIIHILMSL